MAVQLILKNSSVANRRPAANQLSNGEIALNYNAAGAFLTCRDTNGNIQQVGGVTVAETAPSTPVKQTLWLKPSTGTLSIYSGSNWIAVGSVTSVNGQTGAVTLTSADIGLGNVNNTTDLNKPISTATQNALNTKADLVGGKVPTSQLPSLAVSEYLGPAADQAAMLLLSGERGDWCIRTDLSSTFVLITDGGSSIGDWQELATPASPVSSVNGFTGAVTLGASDVGAATAAQGATADSALQAGDNISDLTNDEGYISSIEAPVQSVNTQTGVVVLGASDVGAATTAQGVLADSALQAGDNISDLTNDENYINSAGAPVQSVNTQTGAVVLGASDVGAVASTGGTFTGDVNISGKLGVGIGYTPSAVFHAQAAGTSGATLAIFDDTGSQNTGRFQIDTTGGTGQDSINLSAINRRYLGLGTFGNPLLVTDSGANSVLIGGTLPSAPNIELNANGSAQFVSIVVNNLTLDGSRISSSGTLNVDAGGTGGINFKTKAANGDYRFYNSAETFSASLRFNNLTANRFITIPDEGGTLALTDSTTGELIVDSLTLGGSTLSASSTLNLASGGAGAINFKTQANYRFYNNADTFYGALRFNLLTADRNLTIPDEDGIVVLKDGATGALTVDNLTLDGATLSSATSLNIESGASAAINFKTQTSNSDYRFYNNAETFYGSLRFKDFTSNQNFNFPNNGGTIALTSDISDATLKENIVDAPSQWADVKATRVRNFYYTETSGQPSGKHIGWIAQEVQAISPGCVVEIPEEDDEGNPTDESCLAIKTQVMLVKAYKALQEAMERIETLEQRLSRLDPMEASKDA